MTMTSPDVVRQRRTRALWVAVAAVVVGVVVAVLGVRAAVASYQRHQSIHDYAEARSTAMYFVKNGAIISASMKQLQALDQQDVGLMKQQRAALDADHVTEFNSLTSSANDRTERQQVLHNRVHQYQAAFERALDR